MPPENYNERQLEKFKKALQNTLRMVNAEKKQNAFTVIKLQTHNIVYCQN